MITARYTWNTDSLQKGFAVHRRTQRVTKLFPIIGIPSLAWGVYEAFTSEQWVTGLPFILFAFILLFAAGPLLTRQFVRAVRRSPSYGNEITYKFDPEQVVISGEGHHAAFTWKRLYAATVTRDGILLYSNKNLFHWVPVTAFESGSDFALVPTYLQQSNVPTKNA